MSELRFFIDRKGLNLFVHGAAGNTLYKVIRNYKKTYMFRPY